jgi:hypothetical protein
MGKKKTLGGMPFTYTLKNWSSVYIYTIMNIFSFVLGLRAQLKMITQGGE